MFYYKLYDDGVFLGAITSNDFKYYIKKEDRMVSTSLKKAQYVRFKQNYYRVKWLSKEDPDVVGKFPTIEAYICSEEEYKKELEKENLE